jgi:hypothetical protein
MSLTSLKNQLKMDQRLENKNEENPRWWLGRELEILNSVIAETILKRQR